MLKPDEAIFKTRVRIARRPTIEMITGVANPPLSLEGHLRLIKHLELMCDPKNGTEGTVQAYYHNFDSVLVLVETPHKHNQLLSFPRAMFDFVAAPPKDVSPCTA